MNGRLEVGRKKKHEYGEGMSDRLEEQACRGGIRSEIMSCLYFAIVLSCLRFLGTCTVVLAPTPGGKL